ncbi:Glycine cleavage system H protein [Dissostichus eleginoides]|uniref:Glycine cleavage system H protein n=1 Tax=Dissostichus eleginoides TaxID=100907 RepID=A0AAD9B986_DISEL|nr:Glycine cleavage system H protein [Dissostichus eleginoides]
MEVNHTGVNIAEQLGEVADAFAIPNYKRVAVVHDNASNMKLCTETLKKESEKWGNVQRVYCSGHTLQLITKKADRTLDLKADQWKLAQETAEVLGPLITLKELLSQEENLSLSATMQMLFNLKRCHLSPELDDSPAIRELKKTLVTEIDSRWKLSLLEPSSIYLLSSALDQRFKQLTFLTNEKKDLVYIEVVRLAEHLHQRQTVREVEGVPAASDREEETAAPPQKETAGYADAV